MSRKKDDSQWWDNPHWTNVFWSQAINPEMPIERRLSGFDSACDRLSHLDKDQVAKLMAIKPDLIKIVRERGEVKTATLVYRVDSAGKLYRTLPL